jgi:hypothetical protein
VGQPLHNVQYLIFLILEDDLAIRFTICSPIVFPKILPDILSLL